MSWLKQIAGGERPMPDTTFDVKPPPRAAKPEAPVVPSPRPAFVEPQVEPALELSHVEVVVEPKPANPTRPQTTILGATLRFRGELRAEEDFTLQGRIEGSIHHTQNLTIGPDGVVKGDSRARTIVVEGTIEGDLYALESISIRATARVVGNLFAPRVSISDGANFNGKVDMATAAKAAKSIVERQSAAALSDRDVDQLLSGT